MSLHISTSGIIDDDIRSAKAPFTELLWLIDLGAGRFAATIDPIWTIGTKVHGGCLIALCSAAAQRCLGSGLMPVAVSASYLHALDPGEVVLQTTIRRSGRSVSLVEVELSQNGIVAVICSVTLGSLDTTGPHHREPLPLDDMAIEPSPGAIQPTPDHPLGQVLNISRGFEIRIDPTTAGFLEGLQGTPQTRIWLRPFASDESEANTAALFAIMAGDVVPPVIMHCGLFGWAPTVQLTVYLRRRPAAGWLRVLASSTVVGETWFEEDHLILDAEGHVVAQSRQLAMPPRQLR